MLKFTGVLDVMIFTIVNTISNVSSILHLYNVKTQSDLFYNCKTWLSKTIYQNRIILIIFYPAYRNVFRRKSPLFTPLK